MGRGEFHIGNMDSSMVFIMSWTLQLQQIAFVMWFLKVLIKACSPIIH